MVRQIPPLNIRDTGEKYQCDTVAELRPARKAICYWAFDEGHDIGNFAPHRQRFAPKAIFGVLPSRAPTLEKCGTPPPSLLTSADEVIE
jgi:hypothetical protein